MIQKKIAKDINLAIIVIFTLVIAIINLKWIQLNQAPPQWDQSVYLNGSEILFDTLKNKGIIEFYHTIPKILGQNRAPLLSIAVIPLYLLFGNGDKIAVFLNIGLLFVFSIYIYKLSSLLFNKKVGLYSVLISQTIPLILSINRQFYTEYLLTTLVIVFLYYLVKSKEFQHHDSNIKLGVTLGLGMLSKISFPLIILGPSIIILITRIKNQKITLKLLLNLIEILAPALIIASSWYIPNLNNLIKFGIDVAWGKTASDYGDPNIFNLSYIINLYKKIIINGSLYYFILFVFLFYKNKKQKIFKKHFPSFLFLISWIIFPLITLTFAVTKDLRYAIPFIPALGIFIAFYYDNFINKYKNTLHNFLLTLILLFLIPLLITLYNSFLSDVSNCTKKPFLKDNTCQNFSTKPDTNNWHLQETINYINKKMPPKIDDSPNFCFIAIEHRTTNLPAFRYYNQLKRPPSKVDFTSVWPCKLDYNDFLEEIKIAKPKCIIFPVISDQNDLSSCYKDEKYKKIYKTLNSGQLNYSLNKTYSVDQNNKIEIYWINK